MVALLLATVECADVYDLDFSISTDIAFATPPDLSRVRAKLQVCQSCVNASEHVLQFSFLVFGLHM